jgi:hypothetical protein
MLYRKERFCMSALEILAKQVKKAAERRHP